MRKIETKRILRCLDANFNRAREGLRVCEDICRFFWNQRSFTKELKAIRHELTQQIVSLTPYQTVVGARNVGKDVGKTSVSSELTRGSVLDIFWANAQRVKESIRVLEEISKLSNKSISENIKKLRYLFYALEKRIAKQKVIGKG